MANSATLPPQGERTGHPAPARGTVPLWALWFGFLAGPAAWSVQTLVDLSVSAHGCYPQLYPLRAPTIVGLRVITLAVSVVAVAVAVVALVIAWRSWRRTRGEHQENSGRGSQHEEGTAALETGEGRTRFMALAGVLTSLTFVVVTAVHLVTIILVPPCLG